MTGNPDVVKALNSVLTWELTAINQYFLHARMFRNWGFGKLNDRDYQDSIRAMKDADELIERILFLEGLPNLQEIDKILIGEDPAEMLHCDMKMESGLCLAVRAAIVTAENARDYVSRDLLEDLLEHSEAHIDWLETQFDLLARLGREHYLQSQL